MSSLILSHEQNGLLTLTINRPDRKNALTQEMYGLLCDELSRAMQEKSIKVVQIRGNENFTSGNDLVDFAAFAQAKTSLHETNTIRFIKTILQFEKPLVAAVKGLAVGIGTTLLFHCDVVITDENSRFTLPFVALGLVPEFGSSMLFPMLAGYNRASYYLLTGQPFRGVEAHEMGLVSHLCKDEDVYDKADKVCQWLTQLPNNSVRAAKRLMHTPDHKERLKQVIAQEIALFEQHLHSPEHQEALAAFFEKRPPDFNQFE
jgi:enoyl-CoA hydratase/carnithine racemase